jgi:tRNA dimethylallyltransferase
MLYKGLLSEVKDLENYKNLRSMNTVGYKELFLYLENKISFNDAVNEIKKNSRRFAKRQVTWLRNKEDIKWIENNIIIDDFMNLINSDSLKH